MKLFKLLSAFAILLTIGFMSCRKKTPFELTSGMKEAKVTCSNGILDANEDGVDCGANCTPCILSYADCQLNDNEFSITNPTTITTAFTAGQVVSSTASGVLELTATSGNKYVKVTFNSATPQLFRSYNVKEYGTLDYDEVAIDYYNGTTLYEGYSDEIHLNKINGKLSVEFCNVYMSTYSSGYKIASGKLTEN